jgi:5'-methylthioadenosine phosphorylase
MTPIAIVHTAAGSELRLGRHRRQPTPFGPVWYANGELGGKATLFLDRSMVDPRAIAYAARALEAERVLALASDPAIATAVTPADTIEFTERRPTTFFETIGSGYVQQEPPFCPELRQALATAGAEAGGILLVVESPALTPRRWWAAQGVTCIGSETQPEGALCRELELCYAALVTPPRVPLASFLEPVLAALPPARGCGCGDTMAQARASGRLAADWREWPLGPLAAEE